MSLTLYAWIKPAFNRLETLSLLVEKATASISVCTPNSFPQEYFCPRSSFRIQIFLIRVLIHPSPDFIAKINTFPDIVPGQTVRRATLLYSSRKEYFDTEEVFAVGLAPLHAVCSCLAATLRSLRPQKPIEDDPRKLKRRARETGSKSSRGVSREPQTSSRGSFCSSEWQIPRRSILSSRERIPAPIARELQEAYYCVGLRVKVQEARSNLKSQHRLLTKVAYRHPSVSSQASGLACRVRTALRFPPKRD